MMYIILEDRTKISWQINQSSPSRQVSSRIHRVIEVQADRSELEMIYLQLKNLPEAPDRRMVSWFGDDAKFIVANLISSEVAS